MSRALEIAKKLHAKQNEEILDFGKGTNVFFEDSRKGEKKCTTFGTSLERPKGTSVFFEEEPKRKGGFARETVFFEEDFHEVPRVNEHRIIVSITTAGADFPVVEFVYTGDLPMLKQKLQKYITGT